MGATGAMTRADGARRASVAPRVLSAATLALFVAAVAAAGTLSPGPNTTASVQLLVSSADHTLSAGGARVSISQSTTTTASGTTRTQQVTGQGVIDSRAHLGQVSESTDGVGTIDFIYVGTTAYFRFPPPLSSRFRTPWVSLDFGSFVSSVQSAIDSPSSYDPVAGLRLLTRSGVARSVTEVGTNEIRGVTATHYRLVLDPSRIASLVSSSQLFGGLNLSSMHVSDLVQDVWIDSANLVRRVRMSSTVSLALPGRPAVRTASVVTQDFYDYGITVHVTAPPPDQVTAEPSFAALFGGG